MSENEIKLETAELPLVTPWEEAIIHEKDINEVERIGLKLARLFTIRIKEMIKREFTKQDFLVLASLSYYKVLFLQRYRSEYRGEEYAVRMTDSIFRVPFSTFHNFLQTREDKGTKIQMKLDNFIKSYMEPCYKE